MYSTKSHIELRGSIHPFTRQILTKDEEMLRKTNLGRKNTWSAERTAYQTK